MVRITPFFSAIKRPFGRGPTTRSLGDLLSMVINHVSKSWDDPPSRAPNTSSGGGINRPLKPAQNTRNQKGLGALGIFTYTFTINSNHMVNMRVPSCLLLPPGGRCCQSPGRNFGWHRHGFLDRFFLLQRCLGKGGELKLLIPIPDILPKNHTRNHLRFVFVCDEI